MMHLLCCTTFAEKFGNNRVDVVVVLHYRCDECEDGSLI